MDHPEQAPQTGEPAAGDSRSPQVMQAGNVDRIRDILFGTQMRDYEARFARMEESLAKEVGEIRETTRRRADQLESYIRKEFELLQARLKADRDERSEHNAQHSQKLAEMSEALTRRLRDLDDHGTQMERELRDHILQQSKDLSDEMRGRHEEIAALIERRVHELRQGKVDRAALAALLTEVSLRLNDQFQIPGSDA
jgi:hypothetical protein